MPIPVPDGVKVRNEGRVVVVEGPKGKARYELPPQVDYKLENGVLAVVRDGDERDDRARHGLVSASATVPTSRASRSISASATRIRSSTSFPRPSRPRWTSRRC
jgi:hypothetical protein